MQTSTTCRICIIALKKTCIKCVEVLYSPIYIYIGNGVEKIAIELVGVYIGIQFSVDF